MGINFLSSGYNWWVDGTAARTITTTNGVNLNGNALTLSNGTTGVNSFTFDGPSSATAVGITGTAGASLSLKNSAAFTAGSSSFGVYLSGGAISSNIAINVDIGSGSKILLGSQSSGGAAIHANIVNNSASGVSLDITNSASGTVALNGVVSGTNGLVLNNSSSGRILLSASNSYSGGTVLNNTGTGTITISNASAFGTGTITSAGAVTNFVRAEVTGLDIANNWQINSGSIVRLNANNSGWAITASGVIAGAGSMMFSNSGVNYYLTGTNNSFGGGVTVGNGTLYFNKMGSAGENSSLGTNRTITVGGPSATTSGQLRWLGANDETSDKTIVVAGTTGGVSILANGATNASLVITGDINSTGSGAKTLTFAGYNTNTLTLTGLINEAGGSNNVVIGASSSGKVVLGNTNNSFSGPVTIGQSTSGQSTVLETAQIGNSGAVSALGKNGTINIGSSSSSALTSLRYVGNGETSDKVINLSGTAGGAILDQSGTGNLKLTSAMTATGVGAKTITLQGSTGGTGELAGAISDLGGNVISLSKLGSGDWTLSGNNSYSGVTTIRDAGGLLKIASTAALSAKTSLIGSSSSTSTATLDLVGGGDYVANSYGTASSGGFNMLFTNSSGSATTLTFTNANNYVTVSSAASGGRSLINQSENLNIQFDGNIDIGSSTADTNTFGGAGNFRVNGSITNGGTAVRGLEKTGSGTLTLAGSGNDYNGATTVRNGVLNLDGALTGSAAVSVSTGTNSPGSVRNVSATLNVSSGGSLLSSSTTTVYSGGNLMVNGTAGGVVLENNGWLGGSGTVGAVTLKSGSYLAPGNSPGLLTTASATFQAGSTYQWEIDNATGAAGTNWDVLSVTGALDMSALSSSSTMNLVLASLSISNFSTSSSFSWTIAQAGSFVGTGFEDGADVTSFFAIDATAFNGGVLPTGGFQVMASTDSNNLRTLNLMAIPEPSTSTMLIFSLGGWIVSRALGRRRS